MPVRPLIALALLLLAFAAPRATADPTGAALRAEKGVLIFAPPSLPDVGLRAAELLRARLVERTALPVRVSADGAEEGAADLIVLLGTPDSANAASGTALGPSALPEPGAEARTIRIAPPEGAYPNAWVVAAIHAHDSRGLLYGIAKLLRLLDARAIRLTMCPAIYSSWDPP